MPGAGEGANSGAGAPWLAKYGFTPLDDLDAKKELVVKPGSEEHLAAELLLAVGEGDTLAVRELIGKGAPVSKTINRTFQTLLHTAAQHNGVEVALLLHAAGADVNAADFTGETPLLAACREGQRDVAEALVDAGADVAAADMNKFTALHWAAYGGHTELCQMLVARGADLFAANISGLTPRQVGEEYTHEQTVKALTKLEKLVPAGQRLEGVHREAIDRAQFKTDMSAFSR